jgi:enoyl-CoA hydratase/carnithine racemase
MESSEQVIYRVDQRVATIIINRPQSRNALNTEVISGIRASLERAAADEDVGSVVLKGAGGRAFCVGADLGSSFSANASFLDVHESRGEFAALLLKIQQCPKPVLAAVEGYCLAGGVGLCLACDMAIASEDSQFGLPEIQRGLWPYMVTALLIRNVGTKKALELCMTGERISAQEAQRIGMINHCVAKEEFEQRVEETASRLASFSPAVMALGKRSFYRIADMELVSALEFLKSQLTINTQLEDLAEGIRAFLEKRPPQWRGR